MNFGTIVLKDGTRAHYTFEHIEQRTRAQRVADYAAKVAGSK